jgi:sulfur-oxidizing protein SoxA
MRDWMIVPKRLFRRLGQGAAATQHFQRSQELGRASLDPANGSDQEASGRTLHANRPQSRVRARRFAAAVIVVLATPAYAQQPLISARDQLSPDLRAMQEDDGRNPGMLWVERGAALWKSKDGRAGKACADCHGAEGAAMKGVAARYPAIDAKTGGLLNVELRINACRTEHMGAAALAYESDELLSLAAFVVYQSRGLPQSTRADGAAAPYFAQGQALYLERQGQLNIACTQCHDQNVGKRLRGDRISSGLPTGYPAYRLDWQKLGSLHRRLRACQLGVRAHQFELGSPEYLALELYLAVRASGASIETPGVRR